MEKKRKLSKTEIKREIFSWASVLIIAIIVAFVLKTYLIILAKIPSCSMENTIMTKDLVLGNRLYSSINRGDIMIFYAPDEFNTLYVKRVIGLPGDKVVIKDARIYINDSNVPLDEDYLPEEWERLNDGMEFQVPEDSYFMMGDNRNHSGDAREWINTYVNKSDMVAKAVCVYFPFKNIGSISGYDYKND